MQHRQGHGCQGEQGPLHLGMSSKQPPPCWPATKDTCGSGKPSTPPHTAATFKPLLCLQLPHLSHREKERVLMGTGELGPDSRLSWNHRVEHLCHYRTSKCFPSGSFFYESVMIYALQTQFCSWWASAASKLTPSQVWEGGGLPWGRQGGYGNCLRGLGA